MTEQAMPTTTTTEPNKIVTEEIEIELSEHDLARLGEELAAALRHRDATEAAAKKIAKEWRDKIEDTDETVARLRDAIHAKRERHEIKCEEIPNGQGGIDIVRCDNGQLLRQRKLTPREQSAREQAEREAAEREREARQGKLFAIDGGKAKGEGATDGGAGDGGDGARHVDVVRDPSGETTTSADGQPLVRARKGRKGRKATEAEVAGATEATDDAAAEAAVEAEADAEAAARAGEVPEPGHENAPVIGEPPGPIDPDDLPF